jgi:hypothetical protein
MPALIYQSALMASRKLALIDQSMVEQSTGLIEVSVEYSTVASNRNAVFAMFKTDSQPPIHPNIVDLEKLQTRRLYLRDFSSTQSNGMLQINATYVGATYQGLVTPLIFSTIESQSIKMRIPVGTFSNVVVVAIYTLDCLFRVEEHSAAIISKETILLGPPPAFTQGTREGLVSGASFSTKDDEAAKGFRDSSGFGNRFNGMEFLDLTATEILNKIAEPLADGTSGVNVTKSRNIEFITPTVKVMSDTYRAEVNLDALTATYLITAA